MFRPMRRNRQQLSSEETISIIEGCTTGILGVNGDDGYPYTVPVNYLYRDGKVIFHGARAGHKFDSIKKDEKVSFCVIGQDKIVPEEVTDYFRSVILFGRARRILDEKEKREAAYALGMKFSPKEAVEDDMKRSFRNVEMFEITIEHMTGKEAIGLVRKKADKKNRPKA